MQSPRPLHAPQTIARGMPAPTPYACGRSFPRRLLLPLALLLLALACLPVASSHGLGPRRARIHAFSPEGVVVVCFDWWEGRGMGGSGCGHLPGSHHHNVARLCVAAKTVRQSTVASDPHSWRSISSLFNPSLFALPNRNTRHSKTSNLS